MVAEAGMVAGATTDDQDQEGRLLVGPIGEIHHHASPAVVLVSLDGFHDVEAFAVEKITTCRCLHLADNVSDLPLSGAVVSRHVASLA